jgi:hypothetical protein
VIPPNLTAIACGTSRIHASVCAMMRMGFVGTRDHSPCLLSMCSSLREASTRRFHPKQLKINRLALGARILRTSALKQRDLFCRRCVDKSASVVDSP